MKTIINGISKVYYYETLEDLKKNEREFNDLKINLEHHEESTPCRICPRFVDGGEFNFILLHNTGDKERDLNKLNECLRIAKLPEFKEL